MILLLPMDGDDTQESELTGILSASFWATVEIEEGRRIVVYFDRRSHNPILREAHLDKDCPRIPWLGNRRLEFVYT